MALIYHQKLRIHVNFSYSISLTTANQPPADGVVTDRDHFWPKSYILLL